jgi:hypothetical protein
MGHRDLEIGLGATFDSYARLQAQQIRNSQAFYLCRPNLIAGAVPLQFDDLKTCRSEDCSDFSRPDGTNTDVAEKLPVTLESHSGRPQWLAGLGHEV